MTAQLEILRNQTRRACEAWCSSAHSRGRAIPKVQLAACDRAASVWDLLVLVGQNAAADRAAQEDLGRLAPAADAARLRMLVLHRDLLGQEKLFGALAPAQKQVIDALRTVTTAQINALRKHVVRLRQAFDKEGRNPDLEELLGP